MFAACRARILSIVENGKILRYFHIKFEKFTQTMSSSAYNPWNYIYIAGPDVPIYFKRKKLAQNESESRISKNESKILKENIAKYLLFAKSESTDSIPSVCYIKSAIKSHLAYRQKDVWKSSVMSHAVLFDEMFTRERLQGHASRGVFCCCTNPEHRTYFHSQLLEFLRENKNFIAYEIVECSNPQNTFKMTLVSDDGNSEDSVIELDMINQPRIKNTGECDIKASPIFSISDISPVFHSYGECLAVLEKLADVMEVKELLDISGKYVTVGTGKSCEETLDHPFIVVEGMDATGKTTLTELLEKKMGAARYFTPPPQITHLRAFFDKYPEIVRRAYYSLGNYIVAHEIIQECKTRPVIMDRFWHSTAAYGIANESSSQDMPAAGHSVYQWPTDLLKPTLVLFLTVSEDVRKQRLTGRGITATFEEISLDNDQLFRQRLCDSYRSMISPSLIEIDAGGTVEEVLDKALGVLASQGVNLNSFNNR